MKARSGKKYDKHLCALKYGVEARFSFTYSAGS